MIIRPPPAPSFPEKKIYLFEGIFQLGFELTEAFFRVQVETMALLCACQMSLLNAEGGMVNM